MQTIHNSAPKKSDDRADHGRQLVRCATFVFLFSIVVLGEPASASGEKPVVGVKIATTNTPISMSSVERNKPLTNQPFSLAFSSNVAMDLVWIPAGEFTMGSDLCEAERPPHKIKITRGFWIGKCEVTQEQYLSVVGKNPSRFKGAKNPVDSVSWNDAAEFAKQLTSKFPERGVFRLPTETEWEYACDPNCPLGWHRVSSGMRVHPVGESQADRTGMYDMLGNVSEWCQDWYDMDYYKKSSDTDPAGPDQGRFRVVRGDSWSVNPRELSSHRRNRADPRNRDDTVGFRVVLTERG